MLRIIALVLIGVGLCSSGSGMAASVDGAEVHWESFGNGPALVFIHGRNRDISDWENQVAEFEAGYRVIVLDLLGHGESGALPDPADELRLLAEAVEAVRAEAGVQQMVLVGHSLGGWVIGEYMMRFPQYVSGIVAADTFFHGPLPQAGFELKRAITFEDVIETPALFVWSEMRGFWPLWQDLLSLYPNGRAELMSDVGHDVMLENPAEFNRLLRGFLEEIDF